MSHPASDTEKSSRFFEFKIPKKDLTIDKKLPILDAHFIEINGNTRMLQITRTNKGSMRTILTGCGTHDKEVISSDNERQDIIYKFEFPLKPVEQGDAGYIYLSENEREFLALSNADYCNTIEGLKWFESSGWYSGSVSFPFEQKVKSVYMLKDEKDNGK